MSSFSTKKSRRGFVVLCLTTLALLVGLPLTVFSQAASAPSTVQLIIDYGDGVRKSFASIPWSRDMTVMDAMNAAKGIHHGFDFAFNGSGNTALLTSIDDVQNQSGGANSRNWQYWVNEQYAQVGFGAQTLKPLDLVYWKFDLSRGP